MTPAPPPPQPPAPPAATYEVGGHVEGLIGPGLVIHLNGASDLAIDLDRAFRFATPLAAGAAYQVGVRTQPAGQLCTVSTGASGTMPAAALSNVVVTCSVLPPPNPATFAVAGNVSGLNGGVLVLQLNGGLSAPVSANGPFTFATLLPDQTTYQVTVQSQPAGQQCGVVAGGAGRINGAAVNDVAVVCTTPPPASTPTYTVGGITTGLLSLGLVLQLNGSTDLGVPAGQAFQFPVGLAQGTAYAVLVKTQPSGQVCTPTANGTGVVGTANVTNVVVACTTPPPPAPATYTVRGTVQGLTGSGLVLRLGAEQVSVAPGAATFAFPTGLVEGSPYQVEVAGQPQGQTCTPSSNSGVVARADVTSVVITCVTPPPPPSTTGLSLDRTSLTFQAEEGQSAPPSQVISGTLTNVTGQVYVRIASTRVGMEDAVYRSLTPTSAELTVTPKEPTRLAPGTLQDTVTVTACFDDPCTRHVTGSPRVVTIAYTVKPNNPPPALKVSDHGIAFASIPGAAHLTRTLTVRDTGGAGSSTWSASANAAWLSVTPSGNNGGALVVTADATPLGNGFHEALVTVTSGNPAITQRETVRVGLYKSSNDARASALDNPLVTGYDAMVTARFAADPVRPLFYTAAGNRISAHHAYTGERTGLLELPNVDIGDIALSDHGRRLYALDRAQGQIVVLDLDRFAVLSSYRFPQLRPWDTWNSRDTTIVYAVVNGQPVLAMSNAMAPAGIYSRNLAPVFRAETGELLGELYFSPWDHSRLTVSRDGSTIYTAEAGLSGVLSTTRVELRSNSLGNVYGKVTAQTPGVNQAGLADFATNETGTRVMLLYATKRSVLEAAFNGTELSWQAAWPAFVDFPNPPNQLNGGGDVEVDAYGRIFARMGSFDLRLYRADGSLLQQWINLWSLDNTGGGGPSGSMRISGDGLRLLGNGKLMDLPP